MARYKSHAQVMANLYAGGRRRARRYRGARVLRFIYRHRGAHRKVCARLTRAQHVHEARCDAAFEAAALKRARTAPAKASFTEPLKWTRRGRRLRKREARS